MSQETANLLQDEDLGGLSIRDLGEQQMRRTQRVVRAHELVVSWVAETTLRTSRYSRASALSAALNEVVRCHTRCRR